MLYTFDAKKKLPRFLIIFYKVKKNIQTTDKICVIKITVKQL